MLMDSGSAALRRDVLVFLCGLKPAVSYKGGSHMDKWISHVEGRNDVDVFGNI